MQLSWVETSDGLAVLAQAVGERCLHRRAGLQRTQHLQRGNGGQGQFGTDVMSDRHQAEDANLQRLVRSLQGTQIVRAEMLEAEHQHLARDHLLHGFRVDAELIANGRADEVGAVAVKTFSDQQINVAQVHKPEVDGDLLRVRQFELDGIGGGVFNHAAMIYHPHGWFKDGF